MIAKGNRECAARYAVIRKFCAQFNRPFTVCDIGANMCYFGLRLTEDFPQCSVVAFEFDHFELRAAHLEKAGANRILLLNRKLRLADLDILSAHHHFDVVLALSVLHHVPGSFDAWLAGLRRLGQTVIAEFAIDDSRRVATRPGYHIPVDAVTLGYGRSHLKHGAAYRPIVSLLGSNP